MDMITLAMAKKYADEQRLGYSAYEKNSNASFSGDIGDKATLPGEVIGVSGTYVRVSDGVFTGGIVKSAGLFAGVVYYEITNCQTAVSDEGIWVLVGDAFKMKEYPFILSFGPAAGQLLGVPAGVYFWTGVDEPHGAYVYVSHMNGRVVETIHHIDPKYIPAMDSITLNGADGKQYKVAVDASGVLTATAIE